MNLITDRTREDVLLGTQKGHYSWEDLNRVEAAVAELASLAQALDIHGNRKVKTNWGLPGSFLASEWPTQSQMERYLGNVDWLCSAVEIKAQLPQSMERLSFDGANRIEEALEEVYARIQRILRTFRYSGTFFAGEENRL